MHLGQFPAFGIGYVPSVLHDIASTQPHRPTRGETEILLWSLHHEVITLDPQLTPKRQLAVSGTLILGIVLHFHLFDVPGFHVYQDELEWVENRHAAWRSAIEHLPHLVFEPGHVRDPLELGDSDILTEIADGLGREATPARTGKGGHARIVPAINLPLLHQLQQLALAYNGVVECKAGKLYLSGHGRHRAILNDPVIDRPVVLELKGAKRMGDVLMGILQGMCEIVHRVDAPLVPRVVVAFVQDAIDDGIPHVHVG